LYSQTIQAFHPSSAILGEKKLSGSGKINVPFIVPALRGFFSIYAGGSALAYFSARNSA
jgi:hypothetical protein